MNVYRKLGFSDFEDFYRSFLVFSQDKRKEHANKSLKILDHIVVENLDIPDEIRKRDVKKNDRLGEILKKRNDISNGEFLQDIISFERFLKEIYESGYDSKDDINTILKEDINGYNVYLDRIDPDKCPHFYLLYIFKEPLGENEFITEDEIIEESLEIANFDNAVRTYFGVLKYLRTNKLED